MLTNRSNKAIGIYWFILSLVISAVNDLIVKSLSLSLTSTNITFFRFFFGTISLLPLVLARGTKEAKNTNISLHLFRGALLFIAMLSWNYSLQKIKLPSATLISFSIPIFTMVFGVLFLKEKCLELEWIVTIMIFLGLCVTIFPYYSRLEFQSIFAIISIMCFAILDILNKKFLNKETTLNMLFYPSVFVLIFSVLINNNFQMPSKKEIVPLLILGINSNLILYFLLKAFSYVQITTLSPYRYLELVISSTFSYLMLEESIDRYVQIGTIIIVPSTYLLFVLRHNKKKSV